MEREPENGEPAEIKIIKEAYEKAFMFVNKGLNTDELGQKEEAKNYYKQGIGHLLRGISIAAAEPGHTGPAWEAARQMQQKMKETLQNVRTRLEILEKGLATSLRNDLQDVPKLYPEFPPKDACKKSPEQESVSTAPSVLKSMGAPQPRVPAQVVRLLLCPYHRPAALPKRHQPTAHRLLRATTLFPMEQIPGSFHPWEKTSTGTVPSRPLLRPWGSMQMS